MKKLFIFELNEFNREMLMQAAQELNLRNIQKVLKLNYTKLVTQDSYESNYLEPWVQWVSAHTGVSSDKHQIKHLGDVPSLSYPQIWEIFSQQEINSGIWGPMNASRNGAKNCLFFVPDPWTFSEQAYPAELNALLDLPRYVSKNYLNLKKSIALKKLMSLLRLIFKAGAGASLLLELPRLLKNKIKFKNEHFVFISFIDYISTKIFLQYKKKYDPTVSLLFLNGIAHLQHHHWHGSDYRNNKRLRYGLQYVDKALKNIFAAMDKNDIFFMMTPLSQANTNSEQPWILYRQIDQATFLRQVGIVFQNVEPHMTYDAHVFFKTEEECQQACQILKAAKIKNKPLFLVEEYPENKKKLFYRIDFTEEVSASQTFEINGQILKFLEFFKVLAHRTGKHIPEGSVYSNAPNIPALMNNHDFAHYLQQLSIDLPKTTMRVNQ